MSARIVACAVFLLTALSPAAAEPAENTAALEALRGLHAGSELRWTPIGGEDGLLIGGQVGWLIDDFIVVGLEGFGLAGPVVLPRPGDTSPEIRMGYGGGRVGVQLFGRSVFHVAPLFLVGGGAMSATGADNEAFFVFEPTLELELAPFSFLRVGGSMSYRLMSEVEIVELDSGNVSGPSLGGFLRGGFF